ncbi:MAG: exonuclease SbcCD subunit D [Spirochaetales bacterium]|nr:exonuclease SbcCD subunit D [Spirochaetales bacterium]
MKFIHTSDWHLGRIFYGIHLTDDQAYVLEQLILLIRDEQPDLLVIAGDVYDRAVPPVEAVDLLDDVLSRIVLDCNVSVLLIPGNHDNPRRLKFGSRFLETRGLYLKCSFMQKMDPVIINDTNGPVYVYAFPYVEPSEAREILCDGTLHSHHLAAKAILDRVKMQHNRNIRSIIVSHSLVAGGEETTESERPLTIGGTGAVDASLFSFAHYSALGHLHKPQKIKDREIHYSGSLLKYSFSEALHEKSVQLVEMDHMGVCTVRRVPLKPRRDVRCIEGHFDDLKKSSPGGMSVDDYLMVTLLDQGVILDAMQRLRELYPNLLNIRKPFVEADMKSTTGVAEYQKIDEKELFASFVSQVTGEELSDIQLKEFEMVQEEMKKKGRSE